MHIIYPEIVKVSLTLFHFEKFMWYLLQKYLKYVFKYKSKKNPLNKSKKKFFLCRLILIHRWHFSKTKSFKIETNICIFIYDRNNPIWDTVLTEKKNKDQRLA